MTTSGVDVVELVGEIDIECSAALERRLVRSIEQRRALVVDLNDCTFVDVRVLRVLRAGYERAREAGSGFVAVLPFGAAPEVRYMMLRVAGVLVPYPLVPDRAAALVVLTRLARERVASVTRSERVRELRASIWENGRTRERLLAERDVLVLVQRETLQAWAPGRLRGAG